MEAIQDDSVTVTGISESGLSSFGIKMAEYAKAIPITMWNDAVIIADIICKLEMGQIICGSDRA